MKHALVRWGTACLVAIAMTGCGGGGGGGAVPGGAVAVKDAITAAGAVAANDTATNSSAPFTVVQDAGVAAVTINNSPPKVNFAVFSDGKVKTDLVIGNVRFAIAKLVPGTNGNPDQWVNYISSTKTAALNVGTGGAAIPRATALQATTDSTLSLEELEAANLTGQLVFNPDGYYTYTFKTDIKNVAGVTYDPTLTHRVGIQLSYKNAASETVLVNPYYDFTIVDGKSVTVTDPAKTRKMTDVASCNGCHEKLALHGGGRVDTQYCVMCHNPGTVDPESGNNLNLATMVHKIHSGKLLKSKLATGGEDYTIWGYKGTKYNYAEVGFPQDLRNCTVCHSGANPKTPQGDNWKTKPSKEACLTCHANNTGSKWDTSHVNFVTVAGTEFFIGVGAKAKDLPNSACVNCHKVGSAIAPERVHFNQNEENAAKYKMNIESTTYDAATRKVTVKYFLSDPTNGNKAYPLVTSDCTAGPNCTNATKFGNLQLRLAYQNLVGQSTAVTEFSAYNNGGNNAFAFAYKGVNDGNDHYTVDITLPADSATAVASGTARVVSMGQIKELKLQVKTNVEPRPVDTTPPIAPATTTAVNVVVQHTHQDVVLSGSLTPRRAIVSSEKCNVCHGLLGTTSGANTLSDAFHRGERSTVESCVICHDANRASSTVMTNGLALNESYQFKRMIHGIHGNSKRFHPFTRKNAVQGAFCNPANTSPKAKAACDPSLTLASDVENFAAEVAWPGVGINCNACHINNSYKQDLGPLGTSVISNSLSKTGANYTNPNVDLFEASGACVGKTGSVAGKDLACLSTDFTKMPVISPKAASCTACHDSSNAIAHVTTYPSQPAAFGNKTQGEIAGLPRENCDDCHSSGGFQGVDIVHGQK